METITFDHYHFFVLLGVLQCFVLAGLLIGFKKFRKKANIALGVALLTTGFAGIGHVFFHTGITEVYPILTYLPIYNGFLIVLGLYYFVIFLLSPDYQFKTKDYWLMSPVILQYIINLAIFVWQIIQPSFNDNHRNTFFDYVYWVELIVSIFQVGLSIFIQLKLYNYHRQLLNNYADIEGKSLQWLSIFNIIIIGVSIFSIYLKIYTILYDEILWLFRFIWIIQIMLLYALGFIIILKRDVFEIPNFDKKESDIPPKSILSSKTDEHYQKLLQLIEKEKLYQDAQLNMDLLAEKTNLSNSYLSKIINQKEGKNFYDFINSYRVKEVKARLNHADYAHYSILGIALESGFKSKSTFNVVFKKMTGMTPSAYKKSLSS